VIEKLPFKIESADQVKGLPTIGKSLKDHVCMYRFFSVSCVSLSNHIATSGSNKRRDIFVF
jgi:hypothetical protein